MIAAIGLSNFEPSPLLPTMTDPLAPINLSLGHRFAAISCSRVDRILSMRYFMSGCPLAVRLKNL